MNYINILVTLSFAGEGKQYDNIIRYHETIINR